MSMDNSMMVFFLSMLATYSIVGFVWWLLHVVAAWRIFTKAGEAGWKSIIPIYSTYITYKISWKKKNLFWATLAATVLAFVLSPFSIQHPACRAQVPCIWPWRGLCHRHAFL